MHPPQSSESRLLAAVAGVLLIAVFGPPVAQLADYHAFADAHTRWGVPHAFDVLSNLPFALVAMVGAWRLSRLGDALDPVQRALAWLACAGLALTTVGSSWYHLHPDDAGLVVDRGAIAVAFAGIMGLAACRISARAGASLGLALLAAAAAWPLVDALGRLQARGQNRSALPRQAA